MLTELTAISPVDGRYRSKCAALATYFSEEALIKARVEVEIEWLKALAAVVPALRELPLDEAAKAAMEGLADGGAMRVKEIEQVTNHDVKAVEYYIKERLDAGGLGRFKEWVHFGLTSQDINNTAQPLLLRRAMERVIIPAVEELAAKLEALAEEWKDVAMLARTHGQPASPTRLGKEIGVFAYRLRAQIERLKAVPHKGKFGGATGNFNSCVAAFPGVDWPGVANAMYASLGLEREQLTTQISNYDSLAELLDGVARVNTIILDLDRDAWMYVMQDYFKQRIKAGEVGSSAMPHKVNPIDFENSEGNLGLANAILGYLARKLPVSRLQRDLTDSTVTRNIGVPLAHTLIAVKSTLRGLDKLILNKEKVRADLDAAWMVVAEGIQTILRRENYPNPYEALKQLTRVNSRVDQSTISNFINSLEGISDAVKAELRALTPAGYTGI